MIVKKALLINIDKVFKIKYSSLMRLLYFLFIFLIFSCNNNSSNNKRDYSHLTPNGKKMHMALDNKDYKSLIEVLEESGRDINKPITKTGNTLLIRLSSNFEMVKYLVEHGAEVNHQRDDGVTALYLAAQNGKYDIVKYLLEHGADPELEEEGGWTPLMSATQGARYKETREECIKIAWLLIKEHDARLSNGTEPTNTNIKHKRNSAGFGGYKASLLTIAITSKMPDDFIQYLKDRGLTSVFE